MMELTLHKILFIIGKDSYSESSASSSPSGLFLMIDGLDRLQKRVCISVLREILW